MTFYFINNKLVSHRKKKISKYFTLKNIIKLNKNNQEKIFIGDGVGGGKDKKKKGENQDAAKNQGKGQQNSQLKLLKEVESLKQIRTIITDLSNQKQALENLSDEPKFKVLKNILLEFIRSNQHSWNKKEIKDIINIQNLKSANKDIQDADFDEFNRSIDRIDKLVCDFKQIDSLKNNLKNNFKSLPDHYRLSIALFLLKNMLKRTITLTDDQLKEHRLDKLIELKKNVNQKSSNTENEIKNIPVTDRYLQFQMQQYAYRNQNQNNTNNTNNTNKKFYITLDSIAERNRNLEDYGIIYIEDQGCNHNNTNPERTGSIAIDNLKLFKSYDDFQLNFMMFSKIISNFYYEMSSFKCFLPGDLVYSKSDNQIFLILDYNKDENKYDVVTNPHKISICAILQKSLLNKENLKDLVTEFIYSENNFFNQNKNDTLHQNPNLENKYKSVIKTISGDDLVIQINFVENELKLNQIIQTKEKKYFRITTMNVIDNEKKCVGVNLKDSREILQDLNDKQLQEQSPEISIVFNSDGTSKSPFFNYSKSEWDSNILEERNKFKNICNSFSKIFYYDNKNDKLFSFIKSYLSFNVLNNNSNNNSNLNIDFYNHSDIMHNLINNYHNLELQLIKKLSSQTNSFNNLPYYFVQFIDKEFIDQKQHTFNILSTSCNLLSLLNDINSMNFYLNHNFNFLSINNFLKQKIDNDIDIFSKFEYTFDIFKFQKNYGNNLSSKIMIDKLINDYGFTDEIIKSEEINEDEIKSQLWLKYGLDTSIWKFYSNLLINGIFEEPEVNQEEPINFRPNDSKKKNIGKENMTFNDLIKKTADVIKSVINQIFTIQLSSPLYLKTESYLENIEKNQSINKYNFILDSQIISFLSDILDTSEYINFTIFNKHQNFINRFDTIRFKINPNLNDYKTENEKIFKNYSCQKIGMIIYDLFDHNIFEKNDTNIVPVGLIQIIKNIIINLVFNKLNPGNVIIQNIYNKLYPLLSFIENYYGNNHYYCLNSINKDFEENTNLKNIKDFFKKNLPSKYSNFNELFDDISFKRLFKEEEEDQNRKLIDNITSAQLFKIFSLIDQIGIRIVIENINEEYIYKDLTEDNLIKKLFKNYNNNYDLLINIKDLLIKNIKREYQIQISEFNNDDLNYIDLNDQLLIDKSQNIENRVLKYFNQIMLTNFDEKLLNNNLEDNNNQEKYNHRLNQIFGNHLISQYKTIIKQQNNCLTNNNIINIEIFIGKIDLIYDFHLSFLQQANLQGNETHFNMAKTLFTFLFGPLFINSKITNNEYRIDIRDIEIIDSNNNPSIYDYLKYFYLLCKLYLYQLFILSYGKDPKYQTQTRYDDFKKYNYLTEIFKYVERNHQIILGKKKDIISIFDNNKNSFQTIDCTDTLFKKMIDELFFEYMYNNDITLNINDLTNKFNKISEKINIYDLINVLIKNRFFMSNYFDEVNKPLCLSNKFNKDINDDHFIEKTYDNLFWSINYFNSDDNYLKLYFLYKNSENNNKNSENNNKWSTQIKKSFRVKIIQLTTYIWSMHQYSPVQSNKSNININTYQNNWLNYYKYYATNYSKDNLNVDNIFMINNLFNIPVNKESYCGILSGGIRICHDNINRYFNDNYIPEGNKNYLSNIDNNDIRFFKSLDEETACKDIFGKNMNVKQILTEDIDNIYNFFRQITTTFNNGKMIYDEIFIPNEFNYLGIEKKIPNEIFKFINEKLTNKLGTQLNIKYNLENLNYKLIENYLQEYKNSPIIKNFKNDQYNLDLALDQIIKSIPGLDKMKEDDKFKKLHSEVDKQLKDKIIKLKEEDSLRKNKTLIKNPNEYLVAFNKLNYNQLFSIPEYGLNEFFDEPNCRSYLQDGSKYLIQIFTPYNSLFHAVLLSCSQENINNQDINREIYNLSLEYLQNFPYFPDKLDLIVNKFKTYLSENMNRYYYQLFIHGNKDENKNVEYFKTLELYRSYLINEINSNNYKGNKFDIPYIGYILKKNIIVFNNSDDINSIKHNNFNLKNNCILLKSIDDNNFNLIGLFNNNLSTVTGNNLCYYYYDNILSVNGNISGIFNCLIQDKNDFTFNNQLNPLIIKIIYEMIDDNEITFPEKDFYFIEKSDFIKIKSFLNTNDFQSPNIIKHPNPNSRKLLVKYSIYNQKNIDRDIIYIDPDDPKNYIEGKYKNNINFNIFYNDDITIEYRDSIRNMTKEEMFPINNCWKVLDLQLKRENNYSNYIQELLEDLEKDNNFGIYKFLIDHDFFLEMALENHNKSYSNFKDEKNQLFQNWNFTITNNQMKYDILEEIVNNCDFEPSIDQKYKELIVKTFLKFRPNQETTYNNHKAKVGYLLSKGPFYEPINNIKVFDSDSNEIDVFVPYNFQVLNNSYFNDDISGLFRFKSYPNPWINNNIASVKNVLLKLYIQEQDISNPELIINNYKLFNPETINIVSNYKPIFDMIKNNISYRKSLRFSNDYIVKNRKIILKNEDYDPVILELKTENNEIIVKNSVFYKKKYVTIVKPIEQDIPIEDISQQELTDKDIDNLNKNIFNHQLKDDFKSSNQNTNQSINFQNIYNPIERLDNLLYCFTKEKEHIFEIINNIGSQPGINSNYELFTLFPTNDKWDYKFVDSNLDISLDLTNSIRLLEKIKNNNFNAIIWKQWILSLTDQIKSGYRLSQLFSNSYNNKLFLYYLFYFFNYWMDIFEENNINWLEYQWLKSILDLILKEYNLLNENYIINDKFEMLNDNYKLETENKKYLDEFMGYVIDKHTNMRIGYYLKVNLLDDNRYLQSYNIIFFNNNLYTDLIHTRILEIYNKYFENRFNFKQGIGFAIDVQKLINLIEVKTKYKNRTEEYKLVQLIVNGNSFDNIYNSIVSQID